ncbi:hypothetical protein J5X98_04785 [Leptothermofonsia sichuanensis E412]|uniref:hypothetical protein n=1 Tax=Leptothermofonsia sichuanensis TaxID=2917832 RepID=UPI001CA6E0DB|nr:hypothetical protein [Leptothermofonsia sichuanensis]QZZ21761.1 hypothetical protein J5X98_04785 [Leptothermofonsia sichuanensis E412]
MSSFKILNAKVQVTLFSLVITACLFIPPFFDLKYRQTKTSFLLLPFFACFVFFSLFSGGSFTVNVLNNSLLKRLYSDGKILSDSNRVSPLKWLLSVDKSSFLLSTILSIAFFLIYLISGLIILGNAEVSNHPNLDLFGADIKDWINLQYYRDGYKPAHTNILLIVQPLETLFSFLPFPQSVSAVLLNSFFSSVSIFLTSVLFWQITQRYLYTFLLTLLLGLTTSHIVFGSIPESYTLGYSSLAITYILFLRCLKNKKLNIGLWILAGIFSFGITITNFVQTLICFIAVLFYIHETLSKKHIKPILEYVGR